MGVLVGYARVSTDDQNLDIQKAALKAHGCGELFCETASGKNAERVELQNCLGYLKTGDTLVVWSLDRLGRSLPDLLAIATDLKERGIYLRTLSDGIDTSTDAGMMLLGVMGAVAQFERNRINERTAAGRAAAKARGMQGGRKSVLTARQVEEIKTLFAMPGARGTDIAKRFGVSRATVYKCLSDTYKAAKT